MRWRQQRVDVAEHRHAEHRCRRTRARRSSKTPRTLTSRRRERLAISCSAWSVAPTMTMLGISHRPPASGGPHHQTVCSTTAGCRRPRPSRRGGGRSRTVTADQPVDEEPRRPWRRCRPGARGRGGRRALPAGEAVHGQGAHRPAEHECADDEREHLRPRATARSPRDRSRRTATVRTVTTARAMVRPAEQVRGQSLAAVGPGADQAPRAHRPAARDLLVDRCRCQSCHRPRRPPGSALGGCAAGSPLSHGALLPRDAHAECTTRYAISWRPTSAAPRPLPGRSSAAPGL